MSVWDVPSLRVGIFFCSSLFWLCLTACRLHCPPFCRLIRFKVAVYTTWAAWWQRCGHLAPTAKERHHQLVSGGSSSVTFANRPIRHVEVSCHLSPLTFLQTLQCEIGNVLLVNHTLSKILKKLKQSKPRMDMKVDMWRPSLLPALCVAKFQSGNSCTSQSPPGFCSHWQSALLCQFITGACIPLQSKTNNHRVIIYLKPLPPQNKVRQFQ